MESKTYVAPGAVITGDVVLENNVSIWYGAVLRGDSGKISVGENSNIQENCVLHEKTTLGKGCTVGHGAIVHGCTVGDNCLIGMGAIVLNGAVIGNNCIVGAGALVTGKMNAPDGSLILGNPATVVKPLTQEQIDGIRADAQHYVNLAKKAFG
ncbi:MAG: gamma carbonic anhydrase family protein [Oscillospiraceae bacterium]|nr:gamma carbonic anhydrase family protein [Oscillospiraceae bacterium]